MRWCEPVTLLTTDPSMINHHPTANCGAIESQQNVCDTKETVKRMSSRLTSRWEEGRAAHPKYLRWALEEEIAA
jgi:hypothetical protein